MKKQKLGKLVLASAIALGGIGGITTAASAAVPQASEWDDFDFNYADSWTGLSSGLANGTTITHQAYIGDLTYPEGSGTTYIPGAVYRLELHDMTTGTVAAIGSEGSNDGIYGSPSKLVAANVIEGHKYRIYETMKDRDGVWCALGDDDGYPDNYMNAGYKELVGYWGSQYSQDKTSYVLATDTAVNFSVKNLNSSTYEYNFMLQKSDGTTWNNVKAINGLRANAGATVSSKYNIKTSDITTTGRYRVRVTVLKVNSDGTKTQQGTFAKQTFNVN
jgi:hypothetical protein